MKALLQRVTQAQVTVDKKLIGSIEQGILVLLGIEPDDNHVTSDRLLKKILHYRLFSDEQGKMNQSVQDINGGVLIVSQFTLVADTKNGLRPSFSSAASPSHSLLIYNQFVEMAKSMHPLIATGEFAAQMQVQLTNDGPVTFLLTA